MSEHDETARKRLFVSKEHFQDVVLFAYESLDSLVLKGLVTGPLSLTQDGRKKLDALRAAGFNPPDDEVELALLCIVNRQRSLKT